MKNDTVDADHSFIQSASCAVNNIAPESSVQPSTAKVACLPFPL